MDTTQQMEKQFQLLAQKRLGLGQTVYKDLEGNEIDVNDGKTFIQICPEDAEIEITE